MAIQSLMMWIFHVIDDFTLFTKYEREAQWTQEGLDSIPDLPPIKWDVRKRARETPGEGQGGGPGQPLGGTTPPASEAVRMGLAKANAALPGGAMGGAPGGAVGDIPGGGLVSRLANNFETSS